MLGLDDPKEIRKYSERKLRNYHIGGYAPPPIKEGLCQEPIVELSKRNRAKRKQLSKIAVVEINEPLPHLNIEEQKKPIQRAAFRKLKGLKDKKNKK